MIRKYARHGLTHHLLYRVWDNMKERCTNPKVHDYPRYGGKGITVCEEWYDVRTFYDWAIANGWKKGLQIDRRDNDGNYEPDNCWFVTRTVNMNNRECVKESKKRAKLIRKEFAKGVTIQELVGKYNRSKQQIYAILRNINSVDPYYIVPKSIIAKKRRKPINQGIVNKIRADFTKRGIKRKGIAEKYNVGYCTVCDIIGGETYKLKNKEV